MQSNNATQAPILVFTRENDLCCFQIVQQYDSQVWASLLTQQLPAGTGIHTFTYSYTVDFKCAYGAPSSRPSQIDAKLLHFGVVSADHNSMVAKAK